MRDNNQEITSNSFPSFDLRVPFTIAPMPETIIDRTTPISFALSFFPRQPA